MPHIKNNLSNMISRAYSVNKSQKSNSIGISEKNIGFLNSESIDRDITDKVKNLLLGFKKSKFCGRNMESNFRSENNLRNKVSQ